MKNKAKFNYPPISLNQNVKIRNKFKLFHTRYSTLFSPNQLLREGKYLNLTDSVLQTHQDNVMEKERK